MMLRIAPIHCDTVDTIFHDARNLCRNGIGPEKQVVTTASKECGSEKGLVAKGGAK